MGQATTIMADNPPAAVSPIASPPSTLSSSSSLRSLVLSPSKSSSVSLSPPKVTIDVEFVDGLTNVNTKLDARYGFFSFSALLLSPFVVSGGPDKSVRQPETSVRDQPV